MCPRIGGRLIERVERDERSHGLSGLERFERLERRNGLERNERSYWCDRFRWGNRRYGRNR